ncbi:MAG: GGDEF domain-containing protein, partial [Planctomycetia bacterium]
TDARTDPLTSVGNRRALDEILANHMALHRRYGSDFSLAIFDVDFFKKINDEEGHLQGDRILQDLAQLLNCEVRQTDFVGRYGGEEFIVIMPGTALENAAGFAERLREIVEERLPITVSGGVASSLVGDSGELILARADLALYDAKGAGRNKVCRHDGEAIEVVISKHIPVATKSDSPKEILDTFDA